jgi:F-type H+-transporting ATPase subunit epsilon
VAELHVELVSVERRIWSGDATRVIARTTVGEIGILPGHAPLLGEVSEAAVVRILQTDGTELTVAVHGGFLSVTDQGLTILAEVAELAGDIDAGRARASLEKARAAGDLAAARRAEGRLAAVGLAEHI